MRKNKRNYKYFFHTMGLLFFLILLVILAANILLPNRKFSEKENRVLASRPPAQLSQIASGRFEQKYETYVNDQFLFRDFWVSLKAGTDRLLGKTQGNGVYLGKDGYLMESFQPPSQEQLNATAGAMINFAQKHPDLKQYALITPNSVNILSDKLPAFAPAADQNPYLDAMKSSLEPAGVTFIDVRDTLTKHKDDGIYYKTDHHWTTEGAYYAYLTAAGAMDINTGTVSYEQAPVTKDFKGTLSAKSGFRSGKKDQIDVFFPKGDAVSSIVNYVDEQQKSASFYDTSKLKTRDKYALFFGGNYAQVKISTPIEENRTLLILKDSYANCLVPFLAPHYRTIVMVDPRYYYGNLEELIQVEGIQEVLYLYNANTFFADTSLELALTPEESSSETTDRKSQVSEPSATTDGSDINDSDTDSSDIDNSDTNTDNSDADSSDADSSDAEA